jgi:hypothetical protein
MIDSERVAKAARRALEALRNILNGNDLALERGQSIVNWKDSDFRKEGNEAYHELRAALTADAQPVEDAPQVCKLPCTRWVYKENTAHPGVAVCDDCDTPMPHLTTGVTTVNYPAPEPLVYKDADALHSGEQIVDSATQAAQKVADALGCGHLRFRSTEWGKRIIAAAVKVAQESRDAEWGAWGIVEVSVRNSSVAEYMKHWEERATKAEVEIARLTARERVPEPELDKGTFQCDICGADTPHSHDPQLVEQERLIRPAFEKTIARKGFGRISKHPDIPYSFQETEFLWQHFKSGWYAGKKIFGQHHAERYANGLRQELAQQKEQK